MAKVIAITGAGVGLGRALAARFAADGHPIVLLGRTASTLEASAAKLDTPSTPIVCDVGDPESVRAAFATIADRHGALDVLINNAAIYEPFFIKDATDAQISAALLANFAGPIHCCRAAIPLMSAGAQIINISSETVGMRHAMFSLYQSSKAGLERFTEALHEEVEPDGIRVTLVRAGQMFGEDSRPPTTDPEIGRRFVEENLKRGLDFRARPVSSFASVAEVLGGLLRLPDDVNIPRMVLEARKC